MPADATSIKPNNHRIYQCQTNKKLELLNKVISDNANADILVVCSKEPKIIQDALQNKAIKVIEDRQLIKEKELKCEMLISYDLPIKNIVYMARFAKATDKAIILLDEDEQKELYQIEMLLGRAIKQETIEGFEYEKVAPKEILSGRKPMTKEQIKEVAKKRYEEKTQEPQEKTYDKPKKDYGDEDKKSYDKNGKKNWDKKKKSPNKFLGKDDSGKAIFSGKSGERNHHYDGTPKGPRKVGRTINIKARKPKEE
ncbi:MAG: hypothetical protein QM497_07305 [Sulfurimonas sp.]